jgi:hypothetical protein
MPKGSALPDAGYLRQLFDYKSDTGELRWRVGRAQKLPGDVAGSLKKDGYLILGLDNKSLKAHRVIWKIVTGNDPVEEIDHIDGNRSNNRWENLREATGCQNGQNRKLYSNSRSGIKGVSYNRAEDKWDAYIMANRKFTLLGRFKSRDDAANIVAAERARLHGNFARFA